MQNLFCQSQSLEFVLIFAQSRAFQIPLAGVVSLTIISLSSRTFPHHHSLIMQEQTHSEDEKVTVGTNTCSHSKKGDYNTDFNIV